MMKTIKMVLVTVLGLILLAGGLVLLKTIENPAGIMRALPYVMIGLGCGAFGHGLGEALSERMKKKHPDVARQVSIEQQDERNIAVTNKAKAKAFDLMIFVFGALMITFALMGVQLAATLLLVFAYLLVALSNIYYRVRYEREM